MSKRFVHLSTPRVVFAITAVIVVYFLAVFVGNFVRHRQLNTEEARLEAQIAQMQAKYETLQALEDYVQSDEYIEEVARQQLGLVREGETAFVAIPTQPSPTPAPGEADPDLWWDVLIR